MTTTPDAPTNDDSSAETGEADDDANFFQLSLTDLTTRQNTLAPPTPTADPPLLPLDQLDPSVLERVVAELVSVGNHLSVQFYGRSGQKQYGLDIVEYRPGAERTVYQVKRYTALTAAQLEQAVDEFAGPPNHHDSPLTVRRFQPTRFVLVTSAKVDDETALTDKIHELQDAYRDDLEVLVWGAEALSRKLRYLPHLVYATFGESWAKQFCGFERNPGLDGGPDPLGLIDDPIDVLGLTTVYEEARSRAHSAPEDAAGALAAVADALVSARFPARASIVRQHQADVLANAEHPAAAFDVLFKLGLLGLTAGTGLSTGSFGHALDVTAERAGGSCVPKRMLLRAIDRWIQEGSRPALTVPALTTLAESSDNDLATLTCLLLEQAVVDGLYETNPPQSVFTDFDETVPERLTQLREIAAGCDTPDPILRARLRCAVADSLISIDTTGDEASAAYTALIEDAGAGYLRGAEGLVPARAARVFAVVGDVQRARRLWMQSVRRSSEGGFHGDARAALLALRLLGHEQGQPAGGQPIGVLPDQRRLITASADTAAETLNALRRGKVLDAYGLSRQALWEARLSGHWMAERLAITYFADAAAAAGHPGIAAVMYVSGGDQNKAAVTAAGLPEPVNVERWSTHGTRLQQIAAMTVQAAQSSTIADADVPQIVNSLIGAAEGYWTAPALIMSPERAAVRAISAFGARIPAGAVDQIKALVDEGPTHGTDDIADLLLETFNAVPERRAELASSIIGMLDVDEPPRNLAGLIAGLPADVHAELAPELGRLAQRGRDAAAEALGAKVTLTHDGQLVARRAAARLLRRPAHEERETIDITTAFGETARLVDLLTAVHELVPVDADQLVPSQCLPVGGAIYSMSRVQNVGEPGPSAAEMLAGESTPDADAVDTAASESTAAPEALAGLVFDRLLVAATDPTEGADMRSRAMSALRFLLPHAGPGRASTAAAALLAVSTDPQYNETDRFMLRSDTALSRARIDGGQRALPRTALVVAAVAFARAVGGHDLTEQDRTLAEALVKQAAALLRSPEAPVRQGGARGLRELAAAHPELSHASSALLVSHDPDVRAEGVVHAPTDELATLVHDPAAQVRVRVAERTNELAGSERTALLHDVDARVRIRATRAL